MFITNDFNDYKILDTGDGMKLESWQNIILARPDPQVIWEKQSPRIWNTSHGKYERSSSGGGKWNFSKTKASR